MRFLFDYKIFENVQQAKSILKELGISEDDKDYKYLTKMPMDSVTEENVEKLFQEKQVKEKELNDIKNKTIHEMWLKELEELTEEYHIYKNERMRLQMGDLETKKKTIVKTGVKKIIKSASKLLIEE